MQTRLSPHGITHRGWALTLAGAALLGLAASLVCPSNVWAQRQYDPDHPFVRERVDAGLEFLRTQRPSNTGQAVMMALAINEAHRRYYGRPAPDNDHVRYAVQQIQEHLATPRFGATEPFDALYMPALAVIFLMDLDPQQYATEIQQLLDFLEERQLPNGTWNYERVPDNTTGDTSQIQYVCLAMWLAHRHGFQVDMERAQRALNWLVAAQRADGGWTYHVPVPAGGDSNVRHSLVAAGAGSVYVLADLLELTEQRHQPRMRRDDDISLPPAVMEYREPTVREAAAAAAGRRAAIDRNQVQRSKGLANAWFARNFDRQPEIWKYYYLYGFERYAYFRELAEGEMRELSNWYDRGIEFLAANQGANGAWPPGYIESPPVVTTSFAILFMVRSSEILAGDSRSGLLLGGRGFQADTHLDVRGGQIVGQQLIKGIEELIGELDNLSAEDLTRYADAMIQWRLDDDGQSRAAQLARLRGLVNHPRWQARLIAVRVLSRQRSLDSVPALIFALEDDDWEVARAAHDGLRLISRRIDQRPMSDSPDRAEQQQLAQQWTDWYLQLRPGAQLLDR